jgi:hypothetical protein
MLKLDWKLSVKPSATIALAASRNTLHMNTNLASKGGVH